MDDRHAGGAGSASIVVSEAYLAARELLRQAEEDAARIRTEADRYKRQREQEAELLVGKARRMLAIAEERAASLSAAPPPLTIIDIDAPAAQQWDLEPPLLVEELDDDVPLFGSRHTRSELDSILATAVSNAVNRALPSDR